MYTSRITAHGAPLFVENNGYKSGHAAAKEWAKTIDASIKHIDFRSCYGGTGGAFSNGQMLANETNRSVTAYKGLVNNLVGDAQIFHPQSPRVAAFTGAFNHALGTIGAFGKSAFS